MEAEQSLVGAVMINVTAFVTIDRKIGAEDFSGRLNAGRFTSAGGAYGG
ncbi:hypothetical protein [Mesorhizobium sp. 1B3]